MPNDEMTFSVAHGIVSEIIRRNRGLDKIEEVLGAAEKAENYSRKVAGQLKEMEEEKNSLSTLLKDMKNKTKQLKIKLEEQVKEAKKAQSKSIREAGEGERELRKRYSGLEDSLKAEYDDKKEAIDTSLVQAKEQLVSLNREKNAVQTQLDTLTGNLQSVMEKFSATA